MRAASFARDALGFVLLLPAGGSLMHITTGLDRLLQSHDDLPFERVGIVMNQASLDEHGQYACDALARRFPGRLKAIFSPQHGLWGEQQANMIESPHDTYEPLGIPVYSLYSETREPTPEMLNELDVLLIDLQDVGTRVYTFIWTMLNCLRAGAQHGLPVWVLDRPNPLGGHLCEGPPLEGGFESFVGLMSIPMRHGLTIGELAQLANRELNLNANLSVIPMEGWRREIWTAGSGRPWVLPSPNMPRLATAQCYPGQVLLEGTNLSEGRGTTIPFEIVGAPFIDPFRLADELSARRHPGLRVRPIRFVPTFDKWRGERCGGIAWEITDLQQLRSFSVTVSILALVRRLWPTEFAWLPPPYEYEQRLMPIDILFGSSRLRETLDAGSTDPAAVESLLRWDEEAWRGRMDSAKLYGVTGRVF